MKLTGLAVGVLAESKPQLLDLHRLLAPLPHTLVASQVFSGETLGSLPRADVWLVQLDMDDPAAQSLLDAMDDANLPVIVADEDEAPTDATDPSQWPEVRRRERVRRLQTKLDLLIDQQPQKAKRATAVWVLAASTGGPEAVGQFLEALDQPPEQLALIYAQHISPSGHKSLVQMLRQRTGLKVCGTHQNQAIEAGCLYVVSPNQALDIVTPGRITPKQQPWAGRFTPSINQVIAKVARVYGAQGGAVMFTGMGEDGARGCQLLHHLGGQVWIQTPASSAIDSMPRSVERLGCTRFAGNPRELAQALQRRLNRTQVSV
ncbi:MAG TPA: chemotaxis protein CheB [Cellvibrionaceae bacterium]|nr:chemotaxis protein CheB [Cellvibrionaceae bacterium]HMY40874.1 chemotaxis protein CheB [Marinagarivorans sp.]HNG60058.1 chemotaxis protein CheB [Cellvibrionaceae bacterium]